ncbi:helix-turn-helix transcriptional regulator, partial [Rhodanobacter denitrificans]|nr:helix-turn-helix transcriptional regulator [Rhodanobacter denitrificans]
LRSNPADAPGAEQAAVLCALSPAYFSRRFKQQVGMSWSDYVRTHRLHLASRRLLESGQSVAAIADSLGFSTPSHFGELFHRRFGMTPGDYRRAGRNGSMP